MAGGLGGAPSPLGNPAGPGLWRHKGLMLPSGVQHVAKALIREGHPRSEAIAIAVGSVKRWARGGGHVKPRTRALAGKNVADWETKRALAHGSQILPVRAERVSSRVSAQRDANRVGVIRGMR